jgi:hypothetical protein
MIQFDFDWNQPVNVAVVVVLALLLGLQSWFLVFRNVGTIRFSGRNSIRIGLNLILWFSVLAFILQPFATRRPDQSKAIFAAKNLPAKFLGGLSDSLGIERVINVEDLKARSWDTIVLAGQDFDSNFIKALMESGQFPALKWFPYFKRNMPYNLSWKGILRQGELQQIRGNIESSDHQFLRVRYGGKTLDSLALKPGETQFKLSFPAFGLGRSAVELVLQKKTIDTIRFFTRPLERLSFQFVLDYPDFESRNLATWLGKHGHAVKYTTTLSKEVKSDVMINEAKEPDVFVTDVAGSSGEVIRKGLLNGKSVLLLNLTRPFEEIAMINKIFGTKMQVRKVSVKENLPVRGMLTALPFSFVSDNSGVSVQGYPVKVQMSSGKIGVSLLNETFPLLLNGDSVAYEQVWSPIIAAVRPAPKVNVTSEAPAFRHVKANIRINDFEVNPKMLSIGNDTVYLNYSAINSQSAQGSFDPAEHGWLPIHNVPGLEMYVASGKSGDDAFDLKATDSFLKKYNVLRSKRIGDMYGNGQLSNAGVKQKLPAWVWLALILVCLSAVWIEQKVWI